VQPTRRESSHAQVLRRHVVIAHDGGALTTADAAAVDRLAAGLAKVSGVQQVKHRGVSRDGQAAQLQVLAGINLGSDGPARRLVAGLRHTIRASALPSGLHAHLAGPLDVSGVTLTPGRLAALHAMLGDPRTLPAQPRAGAGLPAAVWAAYRAESQFISPDGRTVQFGAGLTAGDPGSNAALHQVPAIRAAVAAVARDTGASAYGVAGEAPATYDVGRASDRDLVRIFPDAIIVIAFLLALVMRSLIAPLYLIASVAISYLAAFGVSVLLFQDATGSGGLNYFTPFLMFVFLLALGEDYNILVMTRIREEADSLPLRQAVTRALESTGSTVTSAGLVLAGTFGVFAVVIAGQPGGGIYQGIFASLAIGIIMDAFLVRTLLVPSTVALLGRWNWWPSTPGRPVDPAPDLTVTPAGVR
jgi:putative drug exporter of the RND superfamily